MSKIEWTQKTWNPIVGCSLKSPGCTNCYAMKMAGRLEAMGQEAYQGTTQRTKNGFAWTGKVNLSETALARAGALIAASIERVHHEIALVEAQTFDITTPADLADGDAGKAAA